MPLYVRVGLLSKGVFHWVVDPLPGGTKLSAVVFMGVFIRILCVFMRILCVFMCYYVYFLKIQALGACATCLRRFGTSPKRRFLKIHLPQKMFFWKSMLWGPVQHACGASGPPKKDAFWKSTSPQRCFFWKSMLWRHKVVVCASSPEDPSI